MNARRKRVNSRQEMWEAALLLLGLAMITVGVCIGAAVAIWALFY